MGGDKIYFKLVTIHLGISAALIIFSKELLSQEKRITPLPISLELLIWEIPTTRATLDDSAAGKRASFAAVVRDPALGVLLILILVATWCQPRTSVERGRERESETD